MIEKVNLFSNIYILHVPKTAGTSIRKALRAKWLSKPFITHCGHETALKDLFPHGKKNRPGAVFLVLRDPVKWYKSLYNFKMNSNLNCPVKNYPRMGKNSWDDFFADCVMVDHGVEGLKKWFKPWERYHERITTLLKTEEGIYSSFYRFYSSFDISLNKEAFKKQTRSFSLEILRIESIEDDLNLAIKKYSRLCPYIKLGKENTSTQSPLGYAQITEKQSNIIIERDKNIFNILLNLRNL